MLSKKVVVILVIVAIVLAGISIAYSALDLGEKIPIKDSDELEDSGQGKIGIEVGSPVIEDKGSEEEGIENG